MLLTHRIAGITFRTESDVPIPYLEKEPFTFFQIDPVAPDIRYRITQLDSQASALPPLDQNERKRIVRTVSFPRHWQDKLLLQSPAVRERVRVGLEQPELVHIGLAWNRAIIHNFARNEVDLLYPSEMAKDFSKPVILARYRNTFAPLLPNFSALMIHGSGVIRQGRTALFLAPDEGGKTTVVQCALHTATPALILNDDQVVLRQEGNRVYAHGTPFGLLTSGPHQARLGGLFLLEKASRFELLPMPPADTLQYIWGEHHHIWTLLPKVLRVRAFEILANACYQVPTYRLRFPKDSIDWAAIDEAMLPPAAG